MSLGVLHLGVHDRSYMLPLQDVQRALRMAWFTPLPPDPEAPQVVGVLNVEGHLRPVVSARHALGLPPAEIQLSQRLLLMQGNPEYLLWVDQILGFLEVPVTDFKPVRYTQSSPVEAVVRTREGTTPVLRPEYFQPPALWEDR